MKSMLPILTAGALALTMHGAFAQKTAVSEEQIQQQFEMRHKQCDPLRGNTKEVCQAEAKSARIVALAELEAAQKNTDAARVELDKTKAKAEFDVAHERCSAQEGNNKDVCQQKAKAARDKKLALLEAHEQATEVVEDATDKSREADYKVAKERCDALSGDAKDKCVDDAQRWFKQ
ncbi:hypothetical protein ACTSKR_02885 [Chitinibacteraceae bacterium HSL-7]